MNPLFKRLFLPVCLLALLWVARRSLAPMGQRGDKPALPQLSLVTYQNERGNVLSVSWAPDGKALVFGDTFGKVQVWSLQ